MSGSSDHFVCLEEEDRGHRKAEGLGGLEVDDQLELHRLLYGQVRRPGALQDLGHVWRSTDQLCLVDQAIRCGTEPALVDEFVQCRAQHAELAGSVSFGKPGYE
jgi:hypothetical protein